ncbi:helix-turn-helix transcriptional regulator [uncultured Nocardioides sp.]|jgi:DNA-binding Xre family transcriptional regulator|uniref:helix-turn-helix domain-containing protein n=1 Tax=uncultured Nocardioides sp. TaxID=198441 RepID=UPI0026257706|nr:helix-turn-helix transcriptional regulator [uncultured Nocardioides sp.]
MKYDRWRFEMRVIDRRVLAHFIKHRRLSYGQLAQKVGCSKATIGHLVSGHVKVTKQEWADAIERHLDAPSGSLFEPKVYRVSENAA